MNHIRNTAPLSPRAALSLIAAAAVLLPITACSSSDKEYALPRSLCGTDVPQSMLKPVLPKGEKLTQHPVSTGETKRCRVHVDGKSVLSVSTERWEDSTTAKDVAQSALGVDPMDQQAGDGRYVYSSTGAVGKVDCPKAEAAHESLWASVRVTHHGTTAPEMLEFIKAYAKSVSGSAECAQ